MKLCQACGCIFNVMHRGLFCSSSQWFEVRGGFFGFIDIGEMVVNFY
jgi:hypothetical protein